MFCAGDGNVFIFSDFSKQEIIISALTANDESMIEALKSGQDIYSRVASMLFKMSYEDCLEHNPDGTVNKEGKDRRKRAKAITLGVNYSKGAKSISEELGLTYEEAQTIIDKFFGAFPATKNEIEWTQEQAKKFGVVESLSGRRRRLPNAQLQEYIFPKNLTSYGLGRLKSGLARCRSRFERTTYCEKHGIENNSGYIAEALRESYNARIQSESSLQMKRAMLSMSRNKRLRELGAKLVLTIHDEACLSCPGEHAEEVAKIMVDCMVNAIPEYAYLMKCDVEIQENWGQ